MTNQGKCFVRCLKIMLTDIRDSEVVGVSCLLFMSNHRLGQIISI